MKTFIKVVYQVELVFPAVKCAYSGCPATPGTPGKPWKTPGKDWPLETPLESPGKIIGYPLNPWKPLEITSP